MRQLGRLMFLRNVLSRSINSQFIFPRSVRHSALRVFKYTSYLYGYFLLQCAHWQMCHSLVKKSLWRTALLYIYGFIGGCVFVVIERKPESNRQLYSRLARQLRRNFTTQFNISISESDFKLFMHQAFDVVTIGNKPDWSIFYGLSFAMTSLTTVGKLGCF